MKTATTIAVCLFLGALALAEFGDANHQHNSYTNGRWHIHPNVWDSSRNRYTNDFTNNHNSHDYHSNGNKTNYYDREEYVEEQEEEQQEREEREQERRAEEALGPLEDTTPEISGVPPRVVTGYQCRVEVNGTVIDNTRCYDAFTFTLEHAHAENYHSGSRQRHTHSIRVGQDESIDVSDLSAIGGHGTVRSTTTQITTQTNTQTTESTIEPSDIIDEIIDKSETEMPDDIEMPEPEEPEGCVEDWGSEVFRKGVTLYSPRWLKDGVDTLGKLYGGYQFNARVRASFFVHIDNHWLVYNGEGDVGDIPITPNMGILVYQPVTSHFLHSRGCPVLNGDSIELGIGANLIGFTDPPLLYERPSDLLSNTIRAVIVSQENLEENTSSLFVVTRKDDPGDEPFWPGQGLIVIAIEPTAINLSVPAAPGANYKVIRTWGAMKGNQ